MANFDGSLEAVELRLHSVRYDMAVNRDSVGHYGGLIRSPITRSCGASYSQHEIRYGAREMSWRPSQMTHQVTYDVEATPIQACNA
eukprot:scaffold1080_cov109-Skeletonema_dohrnii-CCMP3373.AAC.2